MNTKIILSSILVMLITIGWMQQKEIAPPPQPTQLKGEILKGIIYEGEVIPMVELPAIEITGELERLTLVPAAEHEGNFIPSLTLPEVTIYGHAS